MKKAFYELAGFYLPAFFFLDIETHESINNLDELSEENKSTLFHEYVHFLQDITTIFGLINVSHTVDIQKTINHNILNGKEDKIELPVIIQNDDVSGVNIDLFSLYQGDYDQDIDGIEIIQDILIEPNEFIPGFEHIPAVIVQCLDKKGDLKFFNFGAVCIMESMAYLIQNAMFDNVRPAFFPYQIAREVCYYLYPELAADPINVIILCDIAYNSSHPGKFFYDFIIELKNRGIKPTKYTDLYDFFENFQFIELDGTKFSFYDIYKKHAALATKQLSDYFTIPLFKKINKWFEQIIGLGTDFRIKNIGFWLKVLAYPTKGERRNAFIALTNVFGFPLMTNLNHEYYFHHPDIMPDKIVTLKAIHEVNQIMFNGQRGCGMKSFCSKPVDITSSKCEEPWKRATEEQLCPFGQVWKMWGLNAKEISYK